MSRPHEGQVVRTAGAPLDRAPAFVLLVHGRGATAESILDLARELDRPEIAYAAPQAADLTWYPQSFLAPIDRNEPGLSSGFAVLDALLRDAERAGVSGERHLLLGFSQGACLALEYAARNPRRFGGVAGLTGGLIGPAGTGRDYPGSFSGTPVLLGSSDPDPHVPWSRVEETARVLERMGAVVDLRRYPGMAHTINLEEMEVVQIMIDSIAGSTAGSVADPDDRSGAHS